MRQVVHLVHSVPCIILQCPRYLFWLLFTQLGPDHSGAHLATLTAHMPPGILVGHRSLLEGKEARANSTTEGRQDGG